MKKCLLLISFLMIGWLATTTAYATLPAPNQSAMPIDKIAAVVNADVITEGELQKALARTKKQLAKSTQPMPDPATLRNIVINQLIYQKLQLQLAKQNHIKATPAQVTRAIEDIAKNNKLTLSQLKAKLKSRGFTYADFRQQISDQITIGQLQGRAVDSKIDITDQDITNYINQFKKANDKKQYHVMDILIPLADSASKATVTAAKRKAQGMMTKLKKGASMDQVAAGQESDLGWNTLSQLPDVFASNLSTMRPGQIAGPIRAGNGFHIIKLIAVKGTNPKPPTRAQAEKVLRQQQFMKAVNKWLMDARKNAYIKIYHN